MPDNNIYGVDFIARCMAGEALEKAGQKSWTLVAGNNISIQSDEEEKTETISAEIEVDDELSSTSTNPVQNKVIYDALQNVEIDVDDALSTTSENPVQNKVITAALKTKPTSVLPDGTVVNDQKIMALTRQQYDAIQNKDPNTYYMITDDPVPQTTPILRTGYTSVLDDYTSSYDASGNWILTFQPEVSFEKLDVYLQWHFDWGAGTDWPLRTATRSIMLSLTKDVPGPVVSTGMNLYLANSVSNPNNPNSNLLYDVLMGSINVNYDAQTNTVTMTVAKPIMDAISDPGNDKNSLPVVMTNCVANAFGYVAYGSDNYIIYDGLEAGTGIDITNDVISVDMPVGSSINVTVDPSTYVLTMTLYDQDTVPISTATVDLPLESMVVSGTYDSATDEIVLTLQSGQTIRFSVASLVSGLETSAHAAATYQTIAGMSGYATTNDLSDRTYYCTCDTASLTSAKVVTTTQDFKLEKGVIIAVKFDNENGANYVTLNVNNTGGKSIAVGATVPYTGNKPDRCGYGSGYLNYYIYTGTYWHAMGCSRAVNEVPLTDASQNGRVLTNVNGTASWENPATPADMATQTWVGQQGYLTSADEVPTVGSGDDGKVLKATYSGGTGSYAWATPSGGLPVSTSAEEGLALTVDSNGNPLWGSVGWDAIANAIFPPIGSNDGDVLTYDSTTGMASFQAPVLAYGPIYEVIDNDVYHGFNREMASQPILTIPALTVPAGKTPILRLKTTTKNVKSINVRFNTDTIKYYNIDFNLTYQNSENKYQTNIFDFDITNYLNGTDVFKLGCENVGTGNTNVKIYFDYDLEIIFVDTTTHTWQYSDPGD